MADEIMLFPAPRQATWSGGTYALPAAGLILLDAPRAQELTPAAARLQRALAAAGLRWEQSASASAPAELFTAVLRVAPQRVPQPQGYRLHITPAGITVEGHDAAGVFYGACTLNQIIAQSGGQAPQVEIQDWPDFAARGVMLDISRDRVYRMDYLYDLIDRLAGWKINQVQLYTEHTFAYRNHPLVWAKASPMTGEEILALDAFCRERFIELVPNQNSFGHMERWLIHAPYAPLAENNDWFDTPWGTKMKGPFSLAPENPGSIRLISSLYDELLPHFTSRMVNVGCDETVDLGTGASREICAARGAGRVYLDFLLKVYADVQRRGFTMQFWGDIILKHPELVAELPRDIIAMEWGYEAAHPFDHNCGQFAAAGVPFYVCPGTSAWNSLAGRTENALGNLLSAAENGLKHGAIGYLNTDWGDAGHWQTPPASYVGLGMGVAYSWALEANRGLDAAAAISRFAFDDPSGAMGRVAYDLGNVYRVSSLQVSNASVLFRALQTRLDKIGEHGAPTAESLRAAREALHAAMAPLADARMERADAELIEREFLNTARMMEHAVRRAELAAQGGPGSLREDLYEDMGEIIEEYRALWLERSRPGGLDDSARRLENAQADYLK